MTAPPQPPPRVYATVPPRSAGQIVAVVLGVLLLLPGLALIAGGGVLLWVDQGNRTDGYVFTETDDFATTGYALVSERIELATDVDWFPVSAALGTARAEVTSTDPGTDVFVGVAPAADAAGYVDGMERSVVDDLGTTAVDEVPLSGGPPSGPPGDQDFWTAQSSGPGTQTLDWEPADGDWVFVVMNADGSAGVSTDVRVGATLPALGGIAWGVLLGGVVLTAIGVLLLALGLRRRPTVHPGPPSGAFVPAPRGSGPPPAWAPPGAADRPVDAEGEGAPR